MKKVEKAVTEKDAWLNQKFQAQVQLAPHQDPVVQSVSIKAEKKASMMPGPFHYSQLSLKRTPLGPKLLSSLERCPP